MKISSFNCFNYKANTAMVKSLFDKNDIVFLIEHWLGDAEESLLKFVHNDFNIQFESDFANSVSRRGRPFGGRAWITKKNISILRYNVYNKHLSSIEVNLDVESGLKLLIFGIWLPFDSGNSECFAQTNTTYSVIEGIIGNLPVNQPFLIIGDWNTDLLRSRRYEQKLTSFLYSNECVSIGDAFKLSSEYSYSKGAYRAMIDHAICDRFTLSLVKSFDLVVDDLNVGDHLPLSLEIDGSGASTVGDSSPVSNYHNFPWKNAEFQEKYNTKIKSSVKELAEKFIRNRPDLMSICNCMDDLKRLMISSARSAESDRRIVVKRRKCALNNWFLDDDLLAMYQDMLHCRMIAAEDRDNEVSKLNLKKARQKIRLSQRLAIENKKQEITNTFDNLIHLKI